MGCGSAAITNVERICAVNVDCTIFADCPAGHEEKQTEREVWVLVAANFFTRS